MRNQWIHGQQAAQYLRNTGDTIPSHKTKPMLSCTVMHYITMCYNKSQSMPPAQESPSSKNAVSPQENDSDQQIGQTEENDECDIEASDPNEEEDGTEDSKPEHIKL